MNRRPLIVANWKMNLGTPESAQHFVSEFQKEKVSLDQADALICPPFTALGTLSSALKTSSVGLGAQNCFFEDHGAFTGEISPDFLKALNCHYVIIGHSERRQYFGETDEIVRKKLLKALEKGLTPIFCIGESDQQREANATFTVISSQLSQGLKDFTSQQVSQLVIAYEPIWAIGTGKTATPAQAQEVHQSIRNWLQNTYGDSISANLRILYGGSVKPSNIKSLMAESDIDGALVGGASLVPKDFADMIRNSI